jgi:hypothetical protein
MLLLLLQVSALGACVSAMGLAPPEVSRACAAAMGARLGVRNSIEASSPVGWWWSGSRRGGRVVVTDSLARSCRRRGLGPAIDGTAPRCGAVTSASSSVKKATHDSWGREFNPLRLHACVFMTKKKRDL